MRSHLYLRVTDEILEILKIIQDHKSDPISKIEILNAHPNIGIGIATNDSWDTNG